MKKDIIIELKNVSCGYKKNIVLKDVNLTIGSDECIGIIGPNGAGKTTLVKTIIGNLKPIKGEIIKYKDIKFGYVPQLFSIDETFPLTVEDVLNFSLQNKIKQTSTQWNEILDTTGINPKYLYRDLSGGQKQKVLILRALLLQPDVLVLDEPFNDLDFYNVTNLLNFLNELRKNYRFTILIISHSLNIILNFVQKIFVINNSKVSVVESTKDKNNLEEVLNSTFNIKTKLYQIEDKIILI